MKQLHTIHEFCKKAIVSSIEEYTDLLKRLWKNAESFRLGFITEREADSMAMDFIADYVVENFQFNSDVKTPIADIFYDIYKVFICSYSNMELHCQNLDESDMDSTLCGIVRDYFNF